MWRRAQGSAFGVSASGLGFRETKWLGLSVQGQGPGSGFRI